MGYKKIKPVLVIMDNFVDDCGLFEVSELNGGYGCKSKSKHKEDPGKCYSFDCPLAYEASLSDLKEHDFNLYNEHKINFKDELVRGESEEECIPSSRYGSGWMIRHSSI